MTSHRIISESILNRVLFYFFLLEDFVASRASSVGINKRWQQNEAEVTSSKVLMYQGFPYVLN
jgi:hypothetical protein